MECTEKTPKKIKGALMEPFPSEQMTICGGEIKRVIKDGEVTDCTCSICSKSYGKHFLDQSRIRFIQSFNVI